jgi:hypothetical protein
MTAFRENVLGTVLGKRLAAGAVHPSLLPAVPLPGSIPRTPPPSRSLFFFRNGIIRA